MQEKFSYTRTYWNQSVVLKTYEITTMKNQNKMKRKQRLPFNHAISVGGQLEYSNLNFQGQSYSILNDVIKNPNISTLWWDKIYVEDQSEKSETSQLENKVVEEYFSTYQP